MTRVHIVALLTLILTRPALAQPPDPARWFRPEHATAKLLILGTFHFKDAGLDSYKPEVDVDILSEPRQTELRDLLDRLARFAPTKVLVEVDTDRQAVFDERYAAYLAGSYELPGNEVYQIGFRLARRLGHERVYAVDADSRHYEGLPDLEAYAREHGQEELLESPWNERYTALYRRDDHLKAEQSLVETLLYMNSEERIRWGHGHYVLRDRALGRDGEYPSADHLTGWWYNRNLRIYANLLRVMEPGDRLLMVIGAGHLSILRHAAAASPEIDLIDVAEVLESSD